MSDPRPMSEAPTSGDPILVLVVGVLHQARYQGPSDGAVYSGSMSVYNWFSESADRSLYDDELEGWHPMPESSRD